MPTIDPFTAPCKLICPSGVDVSGSIINWDGSPPPPPCKPLSLVVVVYGPPTRLIRILLCELAIVVGG